VAVDTAHLDVDLLALKGNPALNPRKHRVALNHHELSFTIVLKLLGRLGQTTKLQMAGQDDPGKRKRQREKDTAK
jgi:hypothetical protein